MGNTKPVLVALGLELVVRPAGLEQGLVDTATTRNNTDGSTAAAGDGLLRAGRKTNASLVLIGGVADDGGVVAGCPRERTAVTDLLLNVADDGTLGALSDGKDVADGENGLLAAVDEGTGVEALGGNESLLAKLVAVGIPENDTGKRSTSKITRNRYMYASSYHAGQHIPARVVDDLLHNTLNVAIAFREVEGAELGRGLVVVGVRFELYAPG